MVDVCVYSFAVGIADYCDRYGDMIHRVMCSMGPPPSMSSQTETVRNIAAVLDECIPPDQLPRRRQWRNDSLLALAKVKKQMDGQ